MEEIKGKYAVARIFADRIDQSAIDSIMNIVDLEAMKDAKISIMPDVHKCSDYCVVGLVVKGNRIMPDLVSADIACGMDVWKIKEKDIDFERLDSIVKKVNETVHEKASFDFSKLSFKANEEKALQSCSIGNGNHFLEIDKDDEGNLYFVVHSGSRNLGGQIYKHHMDIAEKDCNSNKDEIAALIKRMKAEGREKEIQSELSKISKPKIARAICWLEGDHLRDYINDCLVANEFSIYNRSLIAETVMKEYGLHYEHYLTCIHNYVDEEGIIRKGAISAKKGEIVIIPLSPNLGCLICEGLGNEDYLYSAPHGAGRLMSRKEAKEKISLEGFMKSMEGIYSSTINEGTIDESPAVYKSLEQILPSIEPTVKIIRHIKPLYSYKEPTQLTN